MLAERVGFVLRVPLIGWIPSSRPGFRPARSCASLQRRFAALHGGFLDGKAHATAAQRLGTMIVRGLRSEGLHDLRRPPMKVAVSTERHPSLDRQHQVASLANTTRLS
jgi:hypothetical protein